MRKFVVGDGLSTSQDRTLWATDAWYLGKSSIAQRKTLIFHLVHSNGVCVLNNRNKRLPRA